MVLNPQVDYCDIGNEYGFTNMYDEQERQVEDFELIQYTGFKDKNNKEIFEGDIVCWSPRKNSKVNYDKCYLIKNGIYEMPTPEDTFEVQGFYLKHSSVNLEYGQSITIVEINNYSVVGNIYENPELFNKEKPKPVIEPFKCECGCTEKKTRDSSTFTQDGAKIFDFKIVCKDCEKPVRE